MRGKCNTQRLLKELLRGLSPPWPRLAVAWQAPYTKAPEGAAARSQLSHHSSHSTRLTTLISQHSSHTTDLSPVIAYHSSRASHLSRVISHRLSLTTLLTPLISYHSFHTTHQAALITQPPITQPLTSHHSSRSTHHTTTHHTTNHLTPLISRHGTWFPFYPVEALWDSAKKICTLKP